jgi:hypothetical protein
LQNFHKSFIQPLFVDEAIAEPRAVDGLNEVEADTPSSVLTTIEQSIQAEQLSFTFSCSCK